MSEKPACCPKCSGLTGYEGKMTETHNMYGDWGKSPEASSSGNDVRWSLMECSDCGAKFNVKSAERGGNQ